MTLTDVLYDWMAAGAVKSGGSILPPIVEAPNGPYASGSQPQYAGQIVNGLGAGIPDTELASLTLTIVDTLSGSVVNGVDNVDVLNIGRGTIDDEGNFVITLESGDTTLTGSPRVQRSLVLSWVTTDVPPLTGRHQANFTVLRLAGSGS